MSTIRKIKAITFDTGGTILDWHTGFLNAFKKVGRKYEYDKDWASLTKKLRKCSLIKVTNLGEVDPPEFNIDNAHLACCLLYTSPSPRDGLLSRMPSSA